MKKTLMDVMNDYIEQGVDPVTREKELWKQFGERHAVVVIDSSGFTRTTRKFGSIYFLSKLAQKRSITIPIIKKYGCETYVTEADSLIGLFPSVQNAFDAVLEISEMIKQKRLMLTENEPFQICAGIGYGDLLVTGGHGEFFGPEMNISSKLGEDTADAGELMLTETAHTHLDESDKVKFSKRNIQASGNDIDCYVMDM